jgi:nucleotide-binding universal stress UspA family protein
MKVLVVVNENPISVDLVRAALSLGDLARMRVLVLFPIPLRDRPVLGELDREWLTNQGEGVAEKVADVFRARSLKTEVVARFGDSASSIIIEEAKRFQAEWIVLGQRLDEDVDGWMVDTTVEYVSTHSSWFGEVVPFGTRHGTL